MRAEINDLGYSKEAAMPLRGCFLFHSEFVSINSTPAVVNPVSARIARLCPGFRIDDNFARQIKAYSNLEITFGSQTLLASTFDGKEREAVMSILRAGKLAPHQIVDLNFGGEHFISYSFLLSTETGTVVALLQRSLDKELAPYLRLERTYLILALAGLLISAALGTWIARGVSKPVLQLAEGARKIGEGDFTHRVQINQADEMGLLAASFNHMSKGLAERNVRDAYRWLSKCPTSFFLRKNVLTPS